VEKGDSLEQALRLLVVRGDEEERPCHLEEDPRRQVGDHGSGAAVERQPLLARLEKSDDLGRGTPRPGGFAVTAFYWQVHEN
jgi:hypothetical protein